MERAFICSVNDGSFPAIVIAESAGKAKAAMVRSAQGANYHYGYTDMVCRRSKPHDILLAPWPCSRQWPRNTPRIYEDPDDARRNFCACSQCREGDSRTFVDAARRINATRETKTPDHGQQRTWEPFIVAVLRKSGYAETDDQLQSMMTLCDLMGPAATLALCDPDWSIRDSIETSRVGQDGVSR